MENTFLKRPLDKIKEPKLKRRRLHRRDGSGTQPTLCSDDKIHLVNSLINLLKEHNDLSFHDLCGCINKELPKITEFETHETLESLVKLDIVKPFNQNDQLYYKIINPKD